MCAFVHGGCASSISTLERSFRGEIYSGHKNRDSEMRDRKCKYMREYRMVDTMPFGCHYFIFRIVNSLISHSFKFFGI